MKTNLNNLSNATLINIINDLNADIYHAELLRIDTESFTIELLEHVDRLTNELFLLKADYNYVIRELTRIENDNNIYGDTDDFHCTCCGKYRVGQAWHIDKQGRPYCKTCFESVPSSFSVAEEVDINKVSKLPHGFIVEEEFEPDYEGYRDNIWFDTTMLIDRCGEWIDFNSIEQINDKISYSCKYCCALAVTDSIYLSSERICDSCNEESGVTF